MRRAGFTLVEVLVVVTIIALAATLVVLSAPDPRPKARDEAERLAIRLSEARAEAILASRPVAMSLDDTGARPLVFAAGRWTPLQGSRLDLDWAEGVRPALEGESLRVAFDPTGLADPVEIRLAGPDAVAVVRVDASGEVSLPQARGNSTLR